MESYKKPQIYSNRGIWASQDIPDCSKDFICSHKRFITAITQSLVRYDFQLKFDWRTIPNERMKNTIAVFSWFCRLGLIHLNHSWIFCPVLTDAALLSWSRLIKFHWEILDWFDFISWRWLSHLNIWPTCSTISVCNEWTKLMPIYVGRTRSVIIR